MEESAKMVNPMYRAWLLAISEAAAVVSYAGEVLAANPAWLSLNHRALSQELSLSQSNLFDYIARLFPEVDSQGLTKLKDAFARIIRGEHYPLEVQFSIEKGLPEKQLALQLGVIADGAFAQILVRAKVTEAAQGSATIPDWLSESLLEELPIGMNVCDQSLRHIWANRAFCRDQRIDRSELFGKRLAELSQFGSLEALENLCSRCLETGAEQTEVVRLYVGKRQLILDLSYYPVLGQDGEAIYAVGAARDITAKIKSQESRSAAQNLLNDILEQMPVGFVAADMNFRVLRMNASASRLFGFAREELIGEHVGTLLAQQYRSENNTFMQTFLRNGNSTTSLSEATEVQGVKKNGALFPMRVSALKLAFGGFPLYCLMVLDMAEIRAAEDRLVEAESNMRQMQKQEALGQLAGNIAHDFNNLMAIVLSYAENIHEDAASTAKLKDMMGEIVQAMRRGAGLTRQILAYAKHQNLEVRPKDMHGQPRNDPGSTFSWRKM